MTNLHLYEIEAAVIGRLGGKPHWFSFEVAASSFGEVQKVAEHMAILKYYDEGGQGDDPQVVELKIDGEKV